MSDALPYEILARIGNGESVTFTAIRDNRGIACERYVIGNGTRRRAIAELWANDPRLLNGSPIAPATVEAALQDAELRAMNAMDERNEDESDGNGNAADAEERKSAATKLVDHVRECADLFHDAAGNVYATIAVDDHSETHPLKSTGFRSWARKLYFDEHERAVPSNAMIDAIATCEGFAIHTGRVFDVDIRVAGRDGNGYLDLCDSGWTCVEVTSTGWRVIPIAAAPVKFIRRPGMLALPMPTTGGSIDDLRELVNVPDGDAWRLVIGWLVMTFRPVGPYPILLVNGEQGSAKSTLCKMLRSLVDPNDCLLRRPPREDRDLLIAAKNSWVLGFDNLSGLQSWMSDALCSIATGAGFATRTLFADDEETRFSAARIAIANGIDTISDRSDLMDRAVTITLPKIGGAYREEAGLWHAFHERRPAILGALLTAVSRALADEETVRLAVRPRMVDFAKWVEAASPALGWARGEFLRAYMTNRSDGNAAAVEASPIGPAIVAMMTGRTEWVGISAELLAELDHFATDRDRKGKGWPTTAPMMTRCLRRIAPNLRSSGVEVSMPDGPAGKGNRRIITIVRVPTEDDTQERVAHVAHVADPVGDTKNADSGDAWRSEATRRRSEDPGNASPENPVLDAENAEATQATRATRNSAQPFVDGNDPPPGWTADQWRAVCAMDGKQEPPGDVECF